MAIPRNDWVEASELSKREMNRLRGKLCSLVESIDLDSRESNLTESQQQAIIALMKQFTYDTQEVVAQLLDLVDNSQMKFRYQNNRLEVQ